MSYVNDWYNVFNILHGKFLNELSLKEQSKMSTLSKGFNSRVFKHHEKIAIDAFTKENINIPFDRMTISEIRNSAFNFLPCFKDLPIPIQKQLEPFRIDFIRQGQIQREASLPGSMSVREVVVTLKALRPAKNGIHFSSITRNRKCKLETNIDSTFKDEKWIEVIMKDKGNEEICKTIPATYQALFDNLDKKIANRFANRTKEEMKIPADIFYTHVEYDLLGEIAKQRDVSKGNLPRCYLLIADRLRAIINPLPNDELEAMLKKESDTERLLEKYSVHMPNDF